MVAIEALACGRDELDEHLPGVPALADNEVPKVAGLLALVVRLEPLLAGPVADGASDRVAEVARQPAFLDLQHLVPTAGLVEAECGPRGCSCERVLELVAVEELRLGGHDRLDRRLGDPADPSQRLAHLLLLRVELSLVGEVLEPAAAAGRVVGAWRLDALGARLDDLDSGGFRVAALDLRDSRANGVARQTAADEDDEPVQARDAVAAVGERVNVKLEFLIPGDGSGHAAQATGALPNPGSWPGAP